MDMDLVEAAKRLRTLRDGVKNSIKEADFQLTPPRPLFLRGRELTGGSFQLSCSIALGLVHAKVERWEIYACLQKDGAPDITHWKLVGTVPFRTLSMRKTFANVEPGHIYHFSVRGVDVFGREGPYSIPTKIRRSNPMEK